MLLQDSNFRPVRMRIAADVAGASLLLCTDRVGSFGAPDVVEVALDRIRLDHALDARFSDRPPDQVWDGWVPESMLHTVGTSH